MKSIFILLSACSAVAQATECQVAEEISMLQARRSVQKRMTATNTKGLNAKGLVQSLEHVANNFASMSTDEVNEALAAASEALSTLSPAIQEQVGFLQDTVNHAAAAVEACHGDAGVAQRAALWEQAEAQAVLSATCEGELATAVADQAQICSAVSVADVQSECACNEAIARREDKEELCAAILTTYGFAYCEHNLQCNTYHDCHETETAVYNQVRGDVDAQMLPVELEYMAAQQSTCIMGVMQANMLAGEAMDFVAIAACSVVDTSSLLLVYPDLPAAPEACPAATTGSPFCPGNLWQPVLGSENGEKVKCNDNVNMQYVADQAECQQLAITNGHPFYSFRHNGESSGHKCMSSSHCDDHLTERTNDWHIYAAGGYQWEMSSNLVQSGTTFTKPEGTSTYDAYAFKGGMTEITITKPTLSGHVRLGLTTDSSDDHGYGQWYDGEYVGHGRYVGLFPGGRMYLPPFADSTYTVDDFITMRLRAGRFSLLKNGVNVATWDDNVAASSLYAKLHFYEAGMSQILPSLTEYTMAAYGAARCPEGKEVPTYDECTAAHRSLGLEVAPIWHGTHGGIPGVCSTREEDWGGGHHFHFNGNTAAQGVSRADLAPVCKK